jgi:hypothetical protein
VIAFVSTSVDRVRTELKEVCLESFELRLVSLISAFSLDR